MEGPDIAMAVLLLVLAAVSLYALCVRVKMLEMLAASDRQLRNGWQQNAGAQLDLQLELARGHEARIAALEEAERARKEPIK